MVSRIDPEGFGFLVTDLSRLIRADMDRRVTEAGVGLTPGESRVLVHVARAGEVRQGVIAERMGVEAMTVTGYLDRLEARGLIERAQDPSDRRAKLVRLTGAGEAALERILPVAAELRTDASRGIDPTDWARLLDMLKTVRANLCRVREADARREGDAT